MDYVHEVAVIVLRFAGLLSIKTVLQMAVCAQVVDMLVVVFAQQLRQHGVVFTQTATAAQKLKMKIAVLFVTGKAELPGWAAATVVILTAVAALVANDLWDATLTVRVSSTVLFKQAQM